MAGGEEIEFATEEEDARAVVGEGAKPARVGFELLDAAIESLCDGVGNAMAKIVKEARQMRLAGARRFLDRLQSAADRGGVPAFKVTFGRPDAFLFPKAAEVFFVQPGPARFEVFAQQVLEAREAGILQISGMVEPKLAGAGQALRLSSVGHAPGGAPGRRRR